MSRGGMRRNPFGLEGVGYSENLKKGFMWQVTFHNYMEHLYLLAVSRFQYKNLPKTVSRRMIEKSLIERGNVLFFENEIMGYMALPAVGKSRLNIYDIPIIREINTASGYHAERDESNSVMIYNDDTRTPFIDTVAFYANKLTRLEMAKDANITQLMRPKILKTTQDNQNSIRQMLNKVELGEPYILYEAEPDLISGDERTSVMDLTSPIIIPDIDRAKFTVLGEYLSRLGYNNINIYKSEHLTVDEGNANNENIMAFRESALQSRRDGFEQVNRMFGLNIQVEFSPSVHVDRDGIISPSNNPARSEREGYAGTAEKEGDE